MMAFETLVTKLIRACKIHALCKNIELQSCMALFPSGLRVSDYIPVVTADIPEVEGRLWDCKKKD